MSKSKIIGKGSFGCVLKPAIDCLEDINKKSKKSKKNKRGKKTKKKKKSSNKNKISKIIFDSKEAKIEFKMNKLVRKIRGHKRWANTWSKMCMSPYYEDLKDINNMDGCFKKKGLRDNNIMLIGEYGGISIYEQLNKLITKSSFENEDSFNKVFITLFKYLENIFIGLVQLKKHGICHLDLSRNNILFHPSGKCYIIDFGLSCTFKDTKCIYNKIDYELNTQRIYTPYPYEFMYGGRPNIDLVNREISNISFKHHRVGHEKYSFIHKEIFGRKDIDELRMHNLKYPRKNMKSLIESLDTYSLGILIPSLIYSFAQNYKIKDRKLKKRFQSPKIQKHLELLKYMTEYFSDNRIPIEEAYKIYKTLI